MGRGLGSGTNEFLEPALEMGEGRDILESGIGEASAVWEFGTEPHPITLTG